MYHIIDLETGEVDQHDYSEADTNTSSFWNKILATEKFRKFVEDKYSLNGPLMAEEDTAEDAYAGLEDTTED